VNVSEAPSDGQTSVDIGSSLALSGAPNARDIGGHTTVGGRIVRRGLVYRSGALCAITDRDLLVLEAVGVAQIIDLRGPSEVAGLGHDRVPAGGACEHVSLPVFDPEIAVYEILGGTLTAARAQQILRDGQGAQLMIDLYRGFVRAPLVRAQFGAALHLIADRQPLPTLFHCTAGKDRTGWLAAVLLTTLGVPVDAIVADYLVTNQRLGEHVQAAVATLCAKKGIRDPTLLEPMLVASPGYIAAAFDEVDLLYGSFDDFLSRGLGLTATDRDRLHENLLS
jgi:protein-tyrosine phosphatase